MDKRKYDIIDELAKNQTIEEIINNIVQNPSEDTLKDLSQMLYEDLLLKDANKIVRMYDEEQLQFFLTRMVLNSVKSKTSRYYYLFKKYNNNVQELTYDED
mgnify:CR=1 FL=1